MEGIYVVQHARDDETFKFTVHAACDRGTELKEGVFMQKLCRAIRSLDLLVKPSGRTRCISPRKLNMAEPSAVVRKSLYLADRRPLAGSVESWPSATSRVQSSHSMV